MSMTADGLRSSAAERDMIVSAKGISKSYGLSAKPHDIFLSRIFGVSRKAVVKTVLKPLDLDIRSGQSIGILGRNGAGKTTLLSILAGILRPSSGEVVHHRRVAALLGIGQDFDANNTGRGNAKRFCIMQGLSRPAMAEAVERIKEFSELDAYFEEPVKTYSSGMRARLNFACANSVDADLIIIDEVLAVGDAEFRSKCYGTIEANIDRGQTYVMVTHSPAIIGNYCDRAIVLDQGGLVFDGDPLSGMQAYDALTRLTQRRKRSERELIDLQRAHAGLSVPEGLKLLNADIAFDGYEARQFTMAASEKPARLDFHFHVDADIEHPRVSVGLRNGKGMMIGVGIAKFPYGGWKSGDVRHVSFTFVPRLVVGGYFVRLVVHDEAEGGRNVVYEKEGLLEFQIIDGERTGLVDLGFRHLGPEAGPEPADPGQASDDR